jgi:hypothetical protein
MEIKSKFNNKISNKKSLLNPEYTDKYYQIREYNYYQGGIDYELKEIQKQIKYYEEEIAKKKYQLDNIFPITQYLKIKDEILQQKKEMKNIKLENDTLLTICNSRIKNTQQAEIEISIKNTEENNKEKLINIKKEIKKKEIKFKELEYKLKEQRNNYSDLMNMINSIKGKIKDAKFLKYSNNENNTINYEEEIEKEQKNIEEEEKKLAQEENEFKKIYNKNEREINRLSTLILEKKILFKNKRDNIRRQELNMKKRNNDKNKNSNSDDNIMDEEEEKEEDEKAQNGFFLTENANIVKKNNNEKIKDVNGGVTGMKNENENGNMNSNKLSKNIINNNKNENDEKKFYLKIKEII